MIRPKGLGRGLDALLAGSDEPAPSKDALQAIAIDRLQTGKYQPRTRMDEASLAELADSIREQGVMRAAVAHGETALDGAALVEFARRSPDMSGWNLVDEVTCDEA